MSRHTIIATAILPVALSIAGCGKGQPDGNTLAPSGFVPPATQAPAPIAGQAQTTPLSNYVGHLPNDAVDGVTFFDRSEVANVLIELVPDERPRHLIAGREATTTPIFRRGALVAAHGCEQNNCGDRNWTVMIAADANADKAVVCYHDAASMGDASRWTTRAQAERRAGDCPSA
jgi:hypothetical protein